MWLYFASFLEVSGSSLGFIDDAENRAMSSSSEPSSIRETPELAILDDEDDLFPRDQVSNMKGFFLLPLVGACPDGCVI